MATYQIGSSISKQFKQVFNELPSRMKRNSVRILPSSGRTFVANESCSFKIPLCLLETASIKLCFKVNGTIANEIYLPSSSAFIEEVSIRSSGRVVQTISSYGYLSSILDRLKNNAGSKLGERAYGNYYTDVAQTKKLLTSGTQMVVNNFYGLLSPETNSFIDTSVMSDLELIVKFANPLAVCDYGATGTFTGATFTDLELVFDTIDFETDFLRRIMLTALQQKGLLNISFNDYLNFSGNDFTVSTSLTTGISSRHLAKIFVAARSITHSYETQATKDAGLSVGKKASATALNTAFHTALGNANSRVWLNIGSQRYPTFDAEPHHMWCMCDTAFNHSGNGIDVLSQDDWVKKSSLCVINLDVDGMQQEKIISGLDTSSYSQVVSVNYANCDSDSKIPYVFMQHISMYAINRDGNVAIGIE